MTQKNGSSYLAIVYLLTLFLCIGLIHIAEMRAIKKHQDMIKNAETIEKNTPNKKAKKVYKKKIKSEPDTAMTSEEPQTPKDTLASKVSPDPNKDFFSNLMKAYEQNRSAENNTQSRTDVVIRYYKKSKDGDRIYSLRDLGFYIHERPAEDDFDRFASNAIFYGDSVKKEDLMVIAYHLMNTGVTIQSITLSKFHDAWKAHSVEIGTDTTALKKSPFTLSTLRKKWDDM